MPRWVESVLHLSFVKLAAHPWRASSPYVTGPCCRAVLLEATKKLPETAQPYAKAAVPVLAIAGEVRTSWMLLSSIVLRRARADRRAPHHPPLAGHVKDRASGGPRLGQARPLVDHHRALPPRGPHASHPRCVPACVRASVVCGPLGVCTSVLRAMRVECVRVCHAVYSHRVCLRMCTSGVCMRGQSVPVVCHP
jgi:hypothetical protein